MDVVARALRSKRLIRVSVFGLRVSNRLEAPGNQA